MDSLRGLAGAGFSGLADDAGIGREAAPPDAAVQNRNTRRSGQAVELGERAAERRPSLVEVEEAGCHGRRLNALRGPIPRSERARGRPERGDGLLVLVPSRSTVLAFATNEPQFGGRRPDMVFHYMKTTVLDSEFETMDFDVEGHLGAVKRSVASLERDGQPARAVVLSREYATTVEDLWDALTSGERIPRWFMPISGDLELGGRYQLEGNAGGVIRTCERPAHLALTWEFGGDVSWVEARLSDDGAGRARLMLTHTALLSPHWDEYGPGAVGVGWEMGLLGLALHIDHPASPKLDEAEFAASRDGKALITGSSEGWGRAAVAAGTDPAAARAAAGRTTAFYTGESAASA